MNCKRCGAQLYEGVRTCMRCGYNEKEVELELKAIERSDKRIKKKISWSVGFVLIIVFLLYRFFLYVDIPNGCFIKILPSLEFSNVTMKKGMKFLKKNHPSDYDDLCSNVSTINPNIGCGGFGGGCFYQNEPNTIHISTAIGNEKGAAKVILHETCHVIQNKEGRPFDEAECYAKDSVIPYR